MSDDDLVFVLQGPRVDPTKISQLLGAAMASLARHARLDRQWRSSNESTPSPIIRDALPGPSNKRPIAEDLTGEVGSLSVAPPSKMSKAPPSPTAPQIPLPTRRTSMGVTTRSPTIVLGRGSRTGQLAASSRFASLASRVSVAPYQQGILPAEENSVMPLQAPRASYPEGSYIEEIMALLWYSLDLKLCRDATSSDDLRPWIGIVYSLAADTAAAHFWFFGRGFQQIEYNAVTKEYNTLPWDPPYGNGQRKTIPMGLADKRAERDPRLIKYLDGGAVSVHRWTDEMPFFVPSWDWRQNNKDHRSHILKFPRVLAEKATRVVASQDVDGELGLAVPGWRYPWTDAKPSDRLTFFDVLKQSRGQTSVETPTALIIRFLIPDDDREAYAPAPVQSFLYYGVGMSCGIRQNDGRYLLPEFSPPLRILPKLPQNPPMHGHPTPPPVFEFWTLRLLSMTLLVPKRADPNYDVLDNTDWEHKTINIGTSRNSTGGLPVILDSGSTFSCLPDFVLGEMWASWFNRDFEEYMFSEEIGLLSHDQDFSAHDILFEFEDNGGQKFTLRCSAKDFLTSPWMNPDDHCKYSLFQKPEDETDKTSLYILGVNFFWVAMLKLESAHRGNRPTETWNPTVQLAPQRVVKDGRKVGEAYDLHFLKDLPPRIAAMALDQPELCPT